MLNLYLYMSVYVSFVVMLVFFYTLTAALLSVFAMHLIWLMKGTFCLKLRINGKVKFWEDLAF